jgi:hypothetical protein
LVRRHAKARGIIHDNLSLIDLARGNRAAALANLKVTVSYGDEAARSMHERLQK